MNIRSSAPDASGSPPPFPQGIAVVIGGTGAIGQSICMALGAKGANVAMTYRRNLAAAEATVARLHATGRYAEAIKLDLSQDCGVDSALRALQERHGRIHTLVFASGADISMAHVASVNPDEWRTIINSDLHGFFNVVHAVLPLMRSGGGGSIVAITSAGIARHPPMDILSVAPKAAIEALLRGIAREEGRFGVRANSVAPGVVDGGLFDRLRERVTPEFVEAMKRNTALRRFGSAEEIAAVTVFLASSEASYVTGQHLAVDGGYSV